MGYPLVIWHSYGKMGHLVPWARMICLFEICWCSCSLRSSFSKGHLNGGFLSHRGTPSPHPSSWDFHIETIQLLGYPHDELEPSKSLWHDWCLMQPSPGRFPLLLEIVVNQSMKKHHGKICWLRYSPLLMDWDIHPINRWLRYSPLWKINGSALLGWLELPNMNVIAKPNMNFPKKATTTWKNQQKFVGMMFESCLR